MNLRDSLQKMVAGMLFLVLATVVRARPMPPAKEDRKSSPAPAVAPRVDGTGTTSFLH